MLTKLRAQALVPKDRVAYSGIRPEFVVDIAGERHCECGRSVDESQLPA